MTLSRKRPLPAHTWPQGIDAGPPQTCETCQAEWKPGYEDPPPWRCQRSQPKRSQGVRARNPERMRRRRYSEGVKHTYGTFWRWASRQPCVVCGTVDGTPADHWKTVKTGGRDPANCLPVCGDHNDRHDLGADTWQARYGVDAEAACERLWRLYRRERPEEAERLMEVVG